jgi:cytochrome c oxidase assembly protein subunit 15
VVAQWTPLGRRGRQLAGAIFLGALAQAPLGYLAVKTDLRWPVVAAHLLLSMLLVAAAVLLVFLAAEAISGRIEPLVPVELRRFGIWVAATGLALLVSGSLATRSPCWRCSWRRSASASSSTASTCRGTSCSSTSPSRRQPGSGSCRS